MRTVAFTLLAWAVVCGSALAQSSHLMTFEEARQRADKGDSFAQAVVALHYQLGWNTEKNPELAVKYALSSANAGEPLGQFRLGALMRAGEGISQDEQQGLALQEDAFSRLYHATDPYSMTAAGVMIFQGKAIGQKVPQDQRRKDAAALYRTAADMGYAPAQFNYAMCADAGHGIPPSIAVRDQYLGMAKYHGYPLADAYFKELGEWYSGDIGAKETLLRLEWGAGEEVRGWYFTPYGSDAETTVFLKGKKNKSNEFTLEAFHYGQRLGIFDLLESGSQNESMLEGQFRRSDGQMEPAMFSALRRRQSRGAVESNASQVLADPEPDRPSIAPVIQKTTSGEDVHAVAQISQPGYPVADENAIFQVKTGRRKYFPTRNIYIHDKKTGLMLTSLNTDPEEMADLKGVFLANDASFVAVQLWSFIGAGGVVQIYGLESGVPILKATHSSFGTVLGIDEENQALYIEDDGKILKSSLFDSKAEPVVSTDAPLLSKIQRVDADNGRSDRLSESNIMDGYWTSVDFESSGTSLRLVRRIQDDLVAGSLGRAFDSVCVVDLLSLESEYFSEVDEILAEREVAQRYAEFYESIYPDREMERGGSRSVYARHLGGEMVATYFDWFRLGDCGVVDSGLWAVVEQSGNRSKSPKLLLVPRINASAETNGEPGFETDQHVSRSKEFIKFVDPLVPPVALSGGVRTGLPVLREQSGRLVCKDDGMLLLFGNDLNVEKAVPWHGSKKAVSVNNDQSLAAGLENASLEMNAVQIFDLNSRKVIGRLYAKQSAAAFLCEDGLYMNRGPVDSLVAFRKGKRTYPFEQFDLRLNRPDIVLARLGAPAEAVGIAKQLREKRLKRMGVTEEMLKPDFHLPELDIVGDVPATTDADQINLAIKASDSKYPLERLKVFVNNVPVNGRDGELLREESKTDSGLLGRITSAFSSAPTGPQTLERTIPVKLAAGRNKIQVSVLNNAGAESLYTNAEVNCTAKRPKPTLYAVALGVSDYANPDWNLKYAAKDAKDVLAKLKAGSGNNYGEVKELLLTDKEVTKESIAKIREFLSSATIDDTVLMFVAGHGLLDSNYDYYFGTTDIDFNNPADKGIAFEEFDDLLADLPSLKKSLLIDTCHAGELDEEEKTLLASAGGVSAALPTANGVAVRSIGTRGMNVKAVEGARGASEWYDRLQGLFVDLRRGSGSTILSSSAGAEYALESSEQQNGLFTYAVLEALDGKKEADTDKDSSMEMSELGEYVKKRVSELTNNKQTPNTRRVNLEGDFTLAKTK